MRFCKFWGHLNLHWEKPALAQSLLLHNLESSCFVKQSGRQFYWQEPESRITKMGITPFVWLYFSPLTRNVACYIGCSPPLLPSPLFTPPLPSLLSSPHIPIPPSRLWLLLTLRMSCYWHVCERRKGLFWHTVQGMQPNRKEGKAWRNECHSLRSREYIRIVTRLSNL